MGSKRASLVLTATVLSTILAPPAFPQGATPVRQDGAAIATSNADRIGQIALLEGHRQAIFGLAFSPDGKRLASASIDRSIRLWDVSGGKQTATLEGHTKQVVAVGYSADGATLLSAGYDRTLRQWDVRTGKQTGLQAADPNKGTQGPQVDNLVVAFNKDASILAFGPDTGSLYVWDTKAGKLRTFEALVQYSGVAFSPDGTTLASSSADAPGGRKFNLIKLWDLKTAKGIVTLTGPHRAGYGSLTYSRDGALIAVVDADDENNCKIQLWDVRARRASTLLKGHPSNVTALAFSADGSVLATSSYDKTIRLWDVKSGKALASLRSADARGGFSALTFSPDGSLIASANLNGTVQLWGVIRK